MSMVQPNPDMANTFVKNNQTFVNHNPALAAAAIQTGDLDAAHTIAASATFSHMANAIDKHISTYNSNVWIMNILKNAPDVINATIHTIKDGLL